MFQQQALWHFTQLSQATGILHFVSGRSGGVSEGELGTLNLSFKAGDARENVLENRRRLAVMLGIAPPQLCFPSQTHSANVRVVRANTRSEELTETDALITNTPGICICVMSADCVPVLLYDPVNQAVGAVHTGWRGTVSKILTRTVEAMQEHFGTKPQDIQAGIGPSISPQVYQVGPEVIGAVREAFGTTQGLINRENGADKGCFNLWVANEQQLRELGVPAGSIEVAGICTYQHSDLFFSARHSGNRAGRFAAGIMLRNGFMA